MQSCAGARLPLAMVGVGETAHVCATKGNPELRQHLAELGFVDGATLEVVAHNDSGVIVLVKGARLALNSSMASHIMVSIS